MKLVVAISSFRSDIDAIRLVTELYNGSYKFSAVVIVCSAGGHDLVKIISSKNYNNCYVLAFDINLGSAGNLFERFKAAAELGGDFVLTLNHDARITSQMFNSMVMRARNCSDRLGALYPIRYTPAKRKYDLSGVGIFPFKFRGVSEIPSLELIDVKWSSSNGALYALKPFRDGHAPDASLWMGFEDYLYGLELQKAGYLQYIVTAALAVDDSEYKTVSSFGRDVTVSDKPLWYLYYGPRNMMLICLYRCRSFKNVLFLILWIFIYPVHIFLSRAGIGRLRGFRYFIVGLIDGLFNKSGKWRLP